MWSSAPSDQASDSYRRAVNQAYVLVRDATPSNATTAAAQAISVLTTAGVDEPEVIDDLSTSPPDLVDARARLQAIVAALDDPARSSDPGGDQQALRTVLAMHRYDALRAPPSLLDRFLTWLRDEIANLLNGIGAGSALSTLAIALAVGLVIAAVAVLLIVVSRRRSWSSLAVGTSSAETRSPADYFARADDLERIHSYAEALRALCAAVAAVLGDERTWDSSPLTVREIFGRAPNPTSLRPLLVPFEAFVYGGRDVDAETYLRAAQVADAYRRREIAA